MADEPAQTEGTADRADTRDATNTQGSEGQQGQGQQGQGQDGQDGQQANGKTFTEAEVSAMVADRLAKYEKSLRKTLKEEMQREAERANMDEAERAAAEANDLRTTVSTLEAELTTERRRSQLAGKVADTDAALKLLDDDHVGEDGKVNVDALLTAYPFLAPEPAQPEPKRGPRPTTSGGGQGEGFSMNNVIRQRAGRG